MAAGCATAPNARLEEGEPKQKAQIEQCLQGIFAAAQNKNFDQLDAYHFYGPKFTKFAGTSAERQDAAAGRQGEHDGLGATKGLKMRADALKIDIFGNVGIATFILAYSFESGGGIVSRRDRATMVFVRADDGWKIAHEHLSPVGP